jgi:hypothetical protein
MAIADLFGMAHQHAPYFKLAAPRAIESVKVADLAFSLNPKQTHFHIASWTQHERLGNGRLIWLVHMVPQLLKERVNHSPLSRKQIFASSRW